MDRPEVWRDERGEVRCEHSGGYCTVSHGSFTFGSELANWRLRAGIEKNKIAVVCSARSTGKKVEGTTSR